MNAAIQLMDFEKLTSAFVEQPGLLRRGNRDLLELNCRLLEH